MRRSLFPLMVTVVASVLSLTGAAHGALAPTPAPTPAPSPAKAVESPPPYPSAAGTSAPAPLPPPANGYRPPTAAYPPAYPPPGAYPPPQSYPPQGTYPPQGGYPQQGGYPPPGGYPGYPVYPANPYSYDPQALTIYQQEKKAVALALALEFVIPGVGSIYAGHARGAAITWGLTLGGFALILVWVADVSHSINDGTSSHEPNQALLLGAMGLIMGGRIYGLYDAYASTTDYNRQLAARLGLPAAFSLGVTPIKSGHNQMAWGPSLSLRF